MTDYTKLVEALRFVGIHQDCNECEPGRWHNEFDRCLFKVAAAAIEALQEQLPKRGEWIFAAGDGKTCCDGWECSSCGKTYHTNVPYFVEFKYCPSCGAKMEVQDEKDT